MSTVGLAIRDQPPNRDTWSVAIAVAILLATGARLGVLLLRPLWHDELFTLWATRLPLPNLVEMLRHDSGPPLFYLLEKPFVHIAEIGRRDALARILPFAAVGCLFTAATWLPENRARIWFAALAAASPLLVVYAAEARAYGLLALLDFALFFLLFRGEPSARRLAAVVALTALALWTHYLAIFFVAACALLLIARRRFRHLAALGAGALTFLPWVPVMALQPVQATSWMREPLGESLLAFVSALGGAGRIPNPQGGPLPDVLVTGGIPVGVLLLIAVARAGRRDPDCADATALTLLTMALILAASFAQPVAFPGRSEMVILPIWLWSVSRAGGAGSAVKWVPAPLLAVAVASTACLLSVPKPEPLPSRAVALIARNAAAQDRVVASGAFYLPARLAADRGELKAAVTAYPVEAALHPGWFELSSPGPADQTRLQETLGQTPPGGKAFLLLYPHQYGPGLESFLVARGTTRDLIRRSDCLLIVWLRG